MSDTATANGPSILSRVNAALRRGDILLAVGVITILTVLIFPMPSWLLDISLALSGW